nr:type II secretion system minor pseudopilin GspI [Marinicella sp. NBU2979]
MPSAANRHGNWPEVGISPDRAQGFTLLEVLMALVVVSVGLMALVQSTQTGAQTATAMRDKTAAYHVADQVMMQLYQKPNLTLGLHRGEEVFAGQTFYWQAELKTTDNSRINRLEVMVGLTRRLEHSEAQLSGFRKAAGW